MSLFLNSFQLISFVADQQKHQKRLADLSEEEILSQKAAYVQSTLPFLKVESAPQTLSYSNTFSSMINLDKDKAKDL